MKGEEGEKKQAHEMEDDLEKETDEEKREKGDEEEKVIRKKWSRMERRVRRIRD